MVQYVVGWDLTTSDVVIPTKVLSLHKDTVRHVSNGPYTSETGEIDNDGMLSSPTKAGIAFQRPTDDHEFGRTRVSTIMRTVWWKLIRGAVKASWCGGIGLDSKLGPVVFQNLGPVGGNGVTAARYRDQVLTPNVVPHFNRFPNKTSQHSVIRTPIHNTDVYKLFF